MTSPGSPTPKDLVARLEGLSEDERHAKLAALRRNDKVLFDRVMAVLRDETTVARTSPADPFRPGDLVGGKYRVLGALGEGASGSVLRAVDTGHIGEREFGSREVALKVSRVDTGHDQLNQDLLRKEALLLRRLRHPRLPVVEALFEDRGRWVVVMEYIAGDSLKKRRREREAPFTVDEAVPWLRDTLRVLDYLHTLHTRPSRDLGGRPVTDTPVFHRDVKPDNLILDAHDNLYVVDLGIARSGISELTAVVPSAVGAGSPGYAAPEVDRGEETRAESDLYSVGMTAYTLLAPAEAREFTARRRSDALHTSGRDPFDAALDGAALPVGLRDWIRTATALDPDDRFSSAALMARALDQALAAPPPAPHVVSAVAASAPSSAVSRPVVWAALGAVALAASGLGVWVAWPATGGPPTAAAVETVGEPASEAADGPAEGPAEASDPEPPPADVQAPPAVTPTPAQTAPVQTAPARPAPQPRAPVEPVTQTGAIQAVVLADDGTPIPSARVRVVGTSSAGTTDGNGDVGFAGLAPGVLMVEVEAPGYVARQFRFELDPGGSVTRTLQFAIEDLKLEAY
ncbi:serine/threonine protein kinase [Rubrivirga marina]|uniref:Protein kinase domain-containing protein n=1 Tax=Rubrivirga marina TaxID=1196024 RepID=A0A271J3B6_9BACT|nr:protein kinase [Rubrivirga marina]PAP77943.1 hypothetical protein BSZ37_16600 [Rubrivirga marina]